MAKKWTAQRNELLLLLIIENAIVKNEDLATKWAQKYPNEDFKPTAIALRDHINALKKSAKGGTGDSASTPKKHTASAGSTPASKHKLPKTPSSSGKRQRLDLISSDEDLDEDEDLAYFTTPVKRERLSRRSKSVKPSYLEPNDQDGSDGDCVLVSGGSLSKPISKPEADHIALNGGGSPVPRGNSMVLKDMPNRVFKARSKMNPPKHDNMADQSDDDEFTLS